MRMGRRKQGLNPLMLAVGDIEGVESAAWPVRGSNQTAEGRRSQDLRAMLGWMYHLQRHRPLVVRRGD
jgi:hypothetical protein